MKKFLDIDFRTADVSKKIESYYNCNVMYMDYSYSKLMYKMATNAIVETERKVAALKHIILLAKEAKRTILENEEEWKKQSELVSSVSDKLILNPNIQTISTVNLEDDSIPPLLEKLIREYEYELMERASELLAMMMVKEDFENLLNSKSLKGEEEEAHSHYIRQHYYSFENYNDEMTKAVESETEEQMKAKIEELVDGIYPKYKNEYDAVEDLDFKPLPFPLSFILFAIKQKQLKKDS